MRMLIAKGSGYADDTTQDRYTVIAEPLASREARSFPRRDGSPGVCYGSHSLKLATDEFGRDLYILVRHGGGSETWRLRPFYDGGDLAEHIKAMPERLQYALLYTLYATGMESAREAIEGERARWSQAFVDGRIRKSRPKGGRVRVTIESPFERDLRLGRVQPERVTIDTVSGEARA